MHAADDRLTRFFAGGQDDLGRTYDEILLWDDERLERVHDYIQWIFPLPERSGANPSAPVLTQASISAVRSTPQMQQRLRAAYLRLMEFYGFQSAGGRVVQSPGFSAVSTNWLYAGNHNHLRLTRMLRSMRLLGLEREAESLWDALRQLYQSERSSGRRSITDETFALWKRAATEPIR
jgi:hypothetical protein